MSMTMENGNGRPPSFWDMDQYRRVVKRVENGYRSCDNFLTMAEERAEIEVRYAKGVRKWTEKWSAMIEKGLEYGSTLEAWRACLQEGSIVAQVHEDCNIKIMGEDGPFYNMYKWKKEHYHKGAFGTLQEAREANDGFAAAQKEFSRHVTKVERAKKAYHSACVAAHKARLFAEEETHEDSVRPEFRRKLQQRAVKLTSQQEKVKALYFKRVAKCNGLAKDRYVQEMTREISKWQALEQTRLATIHAQLILFIRSLDCGSPYKASGFAHLEDVYRRLEESVGLADSVRDVQTWDSQYGTGCEQHWPQFEEMDLQDLDAAAYNEVERKTSFGNAIMRHRRSNHRSSQHNAYSSATDFDDEDDFSSDSFDSSATEAEISARVKHAEQTYGQVTGTTHAPQQQAHVNHGNQAYGQAPGQATTHASQQQTVPNHYPGSQPSTQHHGGHQSTQYPHQPSPHQQPSPPKYGHLVTAVSQQYGGQTHPLTRTHVDETSSLASRQSRYRVKAHKKRSDHRSTGHRQRSSRHSQQHSHNEHSPRPKPFNPTQWQQSTHAWQPVPHEHARDSLTPPTRDVEIPAKNMAPQKTESPLDNYTYKIAESLLSTNGYQGKSLTHQQVSSHYNAGHQGVSHHNTQLVSGGPTQQTVTSQPQASYTPNYQHTSTQITPTPSTWQQTPSQSVVGVNASTPTPSIWQQQIQSTSVVGVGSSTPSIAWQAVKSPSSVTGVINSTQSPLSATWQQQAITTMIPAQQSDAGSKTASPSSHHHHHHRHERHTTLEQAKQLLHLEPGEFMVRALYDFTSSTRDEIPLKRGEVLVQKGKHSENGWAYGRNLEKSGIFPASYVQAVR